MISALVGALLGVSGLRFWWQGLGALAVAAIVLPIISTSLALQFSPLAEQIDMHPANLARVTGISISYSAVLVRHRRGSPLALRAPTGGEG